MVATHCMLHPEALTTKTMPPDLTDVLNQVVKIVRSRPLQTRLFTTLCSEMGSEHRGLLLHIEVMCLARGSLLRHFWPNK